MSKYLKWAKEKDPTIKNWFSILFFADGIKAVWYYRVAHFCYYHKLKFLGRLISQIAKRKYQIEIHPAAIIGKRLFIDHAVGTIIGETAIIGNDCTIYHAVTIGSKDLKIKKRHPSIGNNVLIGAGSIILGNICIGDDVLIGAGSIVVNDCPKGVKVIPKKSEINK